MDPVTLIGKTFVIAFEIFDKDPRFYSDKHYKSLPGQLGSGQVINEKIEAFSWEHLKRLNSGILKD